MGKMKYAKEKLFKFFPLNPERPDEPREYTVEQYLDIYDGVKANIPFIDKKENEALCRFLYAGCTVFDSFSTPTPYFFDRGYMENKLKIFTRALIKAEGMMTQNSVMYILRQLRSELYNEINLIAVGSLEENTYAKYSIKIKEIPDVPRTAEKEKEFADEKEKVMGILEGTKDGSLLTTYSFKIPYLLNENNLDIKFTWKKIPCVLKTRNIICSNSGGILSSDGPLISPSSSRWSNTETEIVIEFSALIDNDLQVSPLLYSDKQKIDFWPFCYQCSYEILSDVFWKLRLDTHIIRNTVPNPSDIGEILSTITSNHHSTIEWKWRSFPGSMAQIVGIGVETKKYDIGIIKTPPMHQRYKIVAQMYLELGLLSESVFWLNAGIEAFFEFKFNEFTSIYPSLMEDMSLSKSYWLEAEEVIVEQCPEVVSKIDWPPISIQRSMFSRLKYVCQNINLKITQKDVLAKFSIINKHRNSLFHGRGDNVLEISSLIDAFSAYDFLIENFVSEGTA